MKAQPPGTMNVYRCAVCDQVVVTRNRDQGIPGDVLPCPLVPCQGEAGWVATLGTGVPPTTPIALEWFRPYTKDDKKAHVTPETRERLAAGGLLLRAVT